MRVQMRPEVHELGKRMKLAVIAVAVLSTGAFAEELRFERQSDWDSWTFPQGAVVPNPDGTVGLNRIDKGTDASLDAPTFLHASKSQKEPIPGGVHVVGSGTATAGNIIDGRSDTWWRPDSADVVADWFVEVDLGRMVLAKKVRLIFPDTLEVKPFRSFSVYVNDGVRASNTRDVFVFTRVGRVTEPNDERIVEYDLETVWPGAATGEHLTTGDTLRFMMVQHVRFVAEEYQPNAALAQIEVITVGDNAVLGSVDRGGGVRGGTDKGNLAGIVDGDKNTIWTISGTADWIESGHWFEIDMGATYWVDQAFYYITSLGTRTPGNFEITTSDGSGAVGLTESRIRSPFDFHHLSLVDNTFSPPRYVYEFDFVPRKARYLFLRRINTPECSQCLLTRISDFYLFGTGYVAEAVMESNFIDLGGTKSIRRLSWDADLPPGTFVEVRSQTGDTFLIEQKFYNKNGVEISEAQWNKLPKSQKQDVVEIQRRGPDWSGWSAVYSGRDEMFLSPSPRRFAQLQVRLGNDDPEVAPLLRHIALHFDDALISGGVLSRILPREAAFDSLQTFTYVIKPTFRFGDRGFDRVSIQVSAPVSDVEVRVGGDPVVPMAVETVADSLRIDLPERIQRDSVEVMFQMRIQENATAFDGWVSVVGDPLQQGVQPEDQHSTTVFVPAVAADGGLIRSVAVSPLVTPNGDGINDEAQIRFTLAKVEGASPAVTIHDLSGRQVRTVDAVDGAHNWDGRDASGQLLPPGSYVCRILLSADVGERAAYRSIGVVY
jgi:hypothetical protein